MGVRPPQQETKTPTSTEFGIAALDARLQNATIRYPITEEELVRELDDPEIPVDPKGSTITLSEALQHVEATQFEAEYELMNALHPVFESRREQVSGGVLGSLRGILPF